MDRFSFLGTSHIGFIEDLYKEYLSDPDSIEPSWRAFFQGYDFSKSDFSDLLEDQTVLPDEVRKEFSVLNLVHGYRTRGHLFTQTNPVRTRRKYSPDLSLKNFGLNDSDLELKFQAASELGLKSPASLRDIINHLENTYCRSIGVEYMYVREPDVISWIQKFIQSNENAPILDSNDRLYILHKLNEAIAFESFLNTKFVGQKRFSIEGAENLIPGLDFLLQKAAEIGVEEVVLGMAHRGRLNVLTNLFGKPASEIFSEFEGKQFEEADFDGDVKYHLGYTAERELDNGKKLKLNIAPNPSHLEAVDPIVAGISRAKSRSSYPEDPSKVLPIMIHGDAAISGQGVVYEVIQMERLSGYGTEGTIHVVVNNQVGFTTNFIDGRSSTYCTDVAKVVLAPVLHVNGDDTEAVIHAMRFAIEYRQKWKRDVFIDLLCYRKYGHNEGDEPRFTQPLLYKTISKHPNPRKIYFDKLLATGEVDSNLILEMESEFKSMLEGLFDDSKKIEKNKIVPFMLDEWNDYSGAKKIDIHNIPDTSISKDRLSAVAKTLTALPPGKKFFKKITRLIGDRKKMAFEKNALDWGMAEMMAYGTLLQDGFNIRISGEDVERGTFSHRHAIIKIEDSEEEVCLLDNIPESKGRFAIYNSHLSEYAVLGFDYGYAMASPDTLVIWEAQFGDFSNGAQIIIDQFIAAAEDKWKVQNGLVLLLPHGYEGQGAEHSSARLERFLQLCAQQNMFVCNPTTPANHFHLLRRQMLQKFRKPLVIMSPKSLLRHPLAVSKMEELGEGKFLPVIPDFIDERKVKKVVFCSGKIYYELLEERNRINDEETGIIRLEQLYPLPKKEMDRQLSKYNKKVKLIWTQEEPANMGAWTYLRVKTDYPFECISPKVSASTAPGSKQAAEQVQKKLIIQTFES
ncbi:MAG: 2-oxoglutarate dehydrogenase E1 component [Owenweeksia sp. TMED14]|nr:MAG: 2-oxoglutarate dehydrogenase E1 component [Owenweeksia sp. TMED14]